MHEGDRKADAPRPVAEVTDIVITMMPSGKFVHEVGLDDSGLIEGFKSGAMHKHMTGIESTPGSPGEPQAGRVTV